MEELEEGAKWWIIILIAGLAIGILFLIWFTLLGPLFNQADYQQFNSSPQHIQAVAQKFSDDCQQLYSTHDPQERKALEQDIYQQASTVNIESMHLNAPTESCVQTSIQDVTQGR